VPNVPLHPALVHLPLGLAIAVPFVAVGLALALWKGLLPRRAWGVAVGLQVLLLAGGVAAQLAGERDSHVVERVVAEKLVDAHEERAEAFLWAAGVVLAASAAVLFVPASATVTVAAVAAAGTLVVAGLGLLAGKAGGELVYLHGAASAHGAPAPRAPDRPGGGHGD
jgi:uncharacterized membrane protein